VMGVDTSADMLRQARERLPGRTFIEANIAHWAPPAGTDVLFANAIFQWVSGHLKQLQRLLGAVDDEVAVVATTGKTGRELFTLSDRAQHFYLVGAMGCAGALGLGLALGSRRPVVVIDGDGAALMKLGNMATIGAKAPANLIHVILDNGRHDSTGGQRTVSAHVSFPEVALACGYRRAVGCRSLDDLGWAVSTALEGGGPHLILADRAAQHNHPDVGGAYGDSYERRFARG